MNKFNFYKRFLAYACVLTLLSGYAPQAYAASDNTAMNSEKVEVPFDYDKEVENKTPFQWHGEKDTVNTSEVSTNNENKKIIAEIYQVPVILRHSVENKLSMGNQALVHTAKVIVNSNGKSQIQLTIQGLKFLNMYGHVWNLFHNEGGEYVQAKVAGFKNDKDLEGGTRKFPYRYLLNRNSSKESVIKVRVWVDAMDAIKSNATTYDQITPGQGYQDARLVLDWNSAKLVKNIYEGSQAFDSGAALNTTKLKEEKSENSKKKEDEKTKETSELNSQMSDSKEVSSSISEESVQQESLNSEVTEAKTISEENSKEEKSTVEKTANNKESSKVLLYVGVPVLVVIVGAVSYLYFIKRK